MFRGDDAELSHTLGRALRHAHEHGQPRVGSEHLLLALTEGTLRATLARHGVTRAALEPVVRSAEPGGAGVAADRDRLAPLGIDIDQLLATAGPMVIDTRSRREPLRPFGAARARRRAELMRPRLGLDVQAALAASLRLALARRDRGHRPEHLALTLVALDPGVNWTLRNAGVDAPALLTGLARAFPPPRRNLALRVERRIGRWARQRDLVRRYQRTTGRPAPSGAVIATLIVG